MKKMEPSLFLKQLILEKEEELQLEGKMLKDQFRQTYESLKPINLIKNTIKEVVTSPDIKNNLVNTAIGLTTGYIAKKIFTGNSDSQLVKLEGVVIEMIVASKVAKNADEIKSIAAIMMKKIINWDPESHSA